MRGTMTYRTAQQRRPMVWPQLRRLVLSAIGFSVLILILTKLLTALIGGAQADAQLAESQATEMALADTGDELVLKRGEYLVSHVAKCGQCHADPTEDAGPSLASTETVAVSTQVDMDAPPMSGLRDWHEEDVVELLKNGRTRDGFTPRAPMPQYRFNDDDAVAVARYLKSLP